MMIIATLLQKGEPRASPIGGYATCLDVMVQAEGEEPKSITLFLHKGDNFDYKPGAVLLLHLDLRQDAVQCFKFTCIAYNPYFLFYIYESD